MDREFLPFEKAAEFLGISHSHLYKLNHYKKLTHYKPGGKLIYYDKQDLINFITSNKIRTTEDITSDVGEFKSKIVNPVIVKKKELLTINDLIHDSRCSVRLYYQIKKKFSNLNMLLSEIHVTDIVSNKLIDEFCNLRGY